MTHHNSLGQFLKGSHWRPHSIIREQSYLIEQYEKLGRSTDDIAKEHNVTPASILFWMRRHGIKRRNGLAAFANRKSKYCTPHSKEEMRAYYQLRSLAFPELIKAATKRTYQHHRDVILARTREWHLKHPGYSRERQRLARLKNPEPFRAQDRKRKKQKTIYTRNRRRTDIKFKIASTLRGRIVAALKGQNKSASTFALLGCSIDSFKLYLESKFESGMSWENYGRGEGKWHIDHIMPCAIFDLTKPEHQRRCFHFSNLQPMWGVENLRKNCKVLSDQFNLL